MYSLSSRGKVSIEKVGSRYLDTRTNCAVSFSSNHEPIVDVTVRMPEMTGFSDSSYCCLRLVKVRITGFASFRRSHFSCFALSLWSVSAEPALKPHVRMIQNQTNATDFSSAVTRARVLNPVDLPALSRRILRLSLLTSFSS